MFVNNYQEGLYFYHRMRRSSVVKGEIGEVIRNRYNITQNSSFARFFPAKFPNFPGLLVIKLFDIFEKWY